MKELKIFGIVAAFTLVLYWGVEPFAHSQMHKHVEGHGLVYDGTADIEEAEASKKEEKVKAKKAFWADVKKIAALTFMALWVLLPIITAKEKKL